MLNFPYLGASDSIRPHLEKIFEGEYAAAQLPIKFEQPPTILDIGANIGAYSWWALETFPGARIVAFEPSPRNVKNYRENLSTHPTPGWQWHIEEAAVYPTDSGSVDLYLSSVNEGMHSIEYDLTNTPSAVRITVPAIHPRRLPNCEVLKVDTEGCELPILEAYLGSRTQWPTLVSLEFHNAFDRIAIEELLDPYIVISASWQHPRLGVMNFCHKDSLKEILK